MAEQVRYSPVSTKREDAVSVFCKPESDTKYAIGVDGATGKGEDYTSIQVWSRRLPFEQVAWFRSKTISTVAGSAVMVNLAKWYNNALLVIETRFPGNAYQDNAIETYRYQNLYRKEDRLDTAPGVSAKFGICTTEADKRLMVNETMRLLYAPDGSQMVFHDPVTIEEFCNFVYIEDKGKVGAAPGSHDDTVMATMLAMRGCVLNPQKPRPKREKVTVDEHTAHMQYLLKKDFERVAGGQKSRLVRV